jgi:hypothetical protein
MVREQNEPSPGDFHTVQGDLLAKDTAQAPEQGGRAGIRSLMAQADSSSKETAAERCGYPPTMSTFGQIAAATVSHRQAAQASRLS